MMCVDLKRHFNWLKVAVMAVLAVMVMMFVLTGTQSAYAGTDNKTYVIDDAGILTSEEERFAGSGNVPAKKTYKAEKRPWDNREYSIGYPLPPYGVAVFEY